MLNLAQQYSQSVQEETTLSADQLKTRHVGKQDPKRHLQDTVERAMGQQVTQSLAMGVLSEVREEVAGMESIALMTARLGDSSKRCAVSIRNCTTP